MALRKAITALLLMSVMTFGMAIAQSEPVVDFNIREGTLASALTELGKQANIEIAFSPLSVSQMNAPAVSGRMSPAEALELLLADSGLLSRRSRHGVILVVKGNAPDTEQRREAGVLKGSDKKGLLAGASTLLAAFGANAQEGVDADGANDASDEIIVTAQRREESLQEVPIAITAIDAARLARSGVTDPSRIEFVAPNVLYSQAGADNRISIRGTSSTGIEVNSDPVVGVFVDGVYQSRPAQALAGFVDIARVEVLRGPQGTLYGRNNTGGSVNIIANTPVNEYDFGIEGLAGNFNNFGVRGFINVPLGDRVAVRLAGTREVRDGYAENLFIPNDTNNDQDQLYLRGSVRVDLSDRTQALFRGSYWSQDGSGSGFNAYKVIGTQLAFDGAFNRENPFTGPGLSITGSDPGGNPQDPYEFSNDIAARRDIEQSQFSLDLTHDFGAVTFKSITAYNNYDRFTLQDSDFSELDQFDVAVTQGAKTFTQEIQFASAGDNRLDWIIGGFFLEDDIEEAFIVNTFQDSTLGFLGPRLIDRNGAADTTSYAVFGQATFELTPQLRITGGGRWTRDEKSIDITDRGGFAKTDSRNFEKVTWRGALDYDLSDRTLLYGSASSGFKSGGFNTNAAPSFAPETVINYEVGVKQTLDGGFINLAGFWAEFDDLQVRSFDSQALSAFTRNSSEATIRGIELEGEIRPDDYWALTGSISYLDGTYGQFIVSDQFGGAPAPSPAVLDATGAPIDGLTDLDGRTLPRAPEFSAKLALSRDIPLGALGTLRPLVQFTYISEYFQSEFNQPLDRQDGYTKTDLRLFWESADNHFFGEVFVQNLENEAVLISGVYGPGNGLFANYGAPRTFGVRFGYNH